MVGLQPGRLVGGQRERRRVGLAEAERAEGGEHRPDLLGHLHRIARGQRPRHEPGPHLGMGVLLPQRPAHLVGLGQRAAGHPGHHLQHLLVEDDHPGGLRQRELEVGVRVDGVPPAVPGHEERRDHVALHRPGPEQRDVDDEVLERLRPELADQLPLPGRLDLEHAERAGAADQLEGRPGRRAGRRRCRRSRRRPGPPRRWRARSPTASGCPAGRA